MSSRRVVGVVVGACELRFVSTVRPLDGVDSALGTFLSVQ